MFNFGIHSVKLLHRVSMHDVEIIFVDGQRQVRVARTASNWQEIVCRAGKPCEYRLRERD